MESEHNESHDQSTSHHHYDFIIDSSHPSSLVVLRDPQSMLHLFPYYIFVDTIKRDQ